MSEHGWQYVKKVSVPAGGTTSIALPPSRPLLQQLTAWASSGERVLTNMTFQMKINNTNFGAAATVVGIKAGKIVFAMNGATFDQAIIPVGKGTLTSPSPQGDAFELSMLLSSAAVVAEEVTVYFSAVGRDGGGTIT